MLTTADITKRYGKRDVTVAAQIDAVISTVWSAISRRGNLAICHPFCKDNPVEAWPGNAACDTIVYYNGLVLHRRILNWLDGKGYDLVIGRDLNRPMADVNWRISELENRQSLLAITIKPDLNIVLAKKPRVMHLLMFKFGLRQQLSEYLTSLVLGFKYRIETGKPVQRNQFGSHRFFSP